MNKWKEIWTGKRSGEIDLSREEFSVYCDLKKADGFDVNVGDEESYFRAFYNAYQKMYEKILSIVGTPESVYEVGCGSGVNLYLFQRRIEGVRLGGIDYSEHMAELAAHILPDAAISCGEGGELDTEEKYDVVISDSVFQYFVSVDYAENVLQRMLEKSRRLVFLGEVHDKEKEEEWLAYRRASMENYDEKYVGLPKLFLERAWLEAIAAKYGRKVEYETSLNEEYWNSRFVYNCYIY